MASATNILISYLALLAILNPEQYFVPGDIAATSEGERVASY